MTTAAAQGHAARALAAQTRQHMDAAKHAAQAAEQARTARQQAKGGRP